MNMTNNTIMSGAGLEFPMVWGEWGKPRWEGRPPKISAF